MKKLYYILIVVNVALVSYFVGANDIYLAKDVNPDGTESIWYPHFYNKSESLQKERELCNALFEGLHRFYANDDNDEWFEGFFQTQEYLTIDSLIDGHWEDFYFYESPKLESWVTEYGTEFEPSEAFKDSVNTHGLKKAIALCKH